MPSFNKVYNILAQRESARVEYSQPTHYPTPQHVFYSVANSLKYRPSNRYSNVLAYDRTAVLANGEGYLNANIVRDTKGRWWVAAQAPLPATFHAFFNAILSRSASKHPLLPQPPRPSKHAILLQLTGWEENGIVKADPYLSHGQTQTFSSGSHSITVHPKSKQRLEDLSSTLTQLELSAPGSEMLVWHYHFDAWPDHGVPAGPAVQALKRLVIEVDRKRVELGGIDECEVWVHCSAGVGRTGTFIALSSLLIDSPLPDKHETSALGPLPPDLEKDCVAQTVDGMREYRGMLVQTPDQLRLIYELVEGNA